MRRSIFAPLCGGAVAAVLALAACNKDYSTDEPFESVPTASLYIGSNNQFLYALDPARGTKKWEFNAGGAIASTPFQDLTNLYVATTTGGLFKLAPNTGTLLMNYRTPKGLQPLQGSIVSSLTGDNAFLYFGTGPSAENPAANYLYAIDVKGDSVEWRFPMGAAVRSSPLLYRDRLYVGCDDGQFYCINKDGTGGWAYNPGTSGQFYASPVAVGRVVYAASTDGNLYALDITNGSLLWRFPVGAAINSSPVAIGGRVIFGANDGKLYCIDTGNRSKPVWTAQTGERIFSSPFVYSQTVYVGSYDNNFYAFDIINGQQKWVLKSNKIFKGSPLVANGIIYVGGFDQQLYALDSLGGRVRWTYDLNGVIETSPVLDDKSGTIQYPTISGASRY